jgi:hypothetical protein
MKVAGTSLTAALLLSFAATVVTVHSGSSNGVDVPSGPQLGAWIETMSWKPRAFVYHGFLSEQECDHIIALATPLMQRSSVVHHNGSTDPQDDIRTSYGTFLRCDFENAFGFSCLDPKNPTVGPLLPDRP